MNEVFGNIKIFTTRETALLYYVKRFSNVPTYLKTKVSQWQQLVLAWQQSKKLLLHCDHPDGKFIWDTVIYQFTNYALDARNKLKSTVYLNIMFWIVKNSCICTNKTFLSISSSLKWHISMSNCVSTHMKEKQHSIILQSLPKKLSFWELGWARIK